MSEVEGLPKRVELLAGKIEAGRFGEGSKSARDAVWFNTDQGRFVFRRKNGPSFGDKALKKYIGKSVKCSGFVVGYSFLADEIKIVANQK